MKTRLLHIGNAGVRFDKVPADVSSAFMERTILPLYGDILERNYSQRRYLTTRQFERNVFKDIQGDFGNEILRLCRLGIFPVMFISFFCWDWNLSRIRIEIDNGTLKRLAKGKREIRFAFPSIETCSQNMIYLSASFIDLLSRYEFSLEIV